MEGCNTTFTNFHAFKRHVRKKHRAFLSLPSQPESLSPETNNSFDEDSLDGDSSDCDLTQITAESSEEIKKNAALWILKVKEGRKLTQSCTEDILSNASELCTYAVSQVGLKVSEVLRASGITPDAIPGLKEIFQETSPYCQPFSHLTSQFLQLQYFRSNLNFVVSAQPKHKIQD